MKVQATILTIAICAAGVSVQPTAGEQDRLCAAYDSVRPHVGPISGLEEVCHGKPLSLAGQAQRPEGD